MKTLCFLTCLSVLVACNDRNKVMTELLNEKQVVQDSLKISSNRSARYEVDYLKAGIKDSTSDDTKKYLDSSTFYAVRETMLKAKLSKLEFSIDSLSKMK